MSLTSPAAVELASLLNSILPNSFNCRLPRVKIDSLALHSRDIQPGGAFIALRGHSTDGNVFIDDAINRGAAVVLAETDVDNSSVSVRETEQGTVSIVHVPFLRKAIGHIAANFYDHPSKALSLIGITGTNGKTSTAHLVAHGIREMVGACGLMGTLGVGVIGHEEIRATANTTPDAISVQKALYGFKSGGAQQGVMEVSSHALEQERVQGCFFKTAVFTNLSRDHLDYHKTMEAYGNAKAKLFTWPGLQNAIINVDDEFGQQLVERTRVAGKLIRLSAARELVDEDHTLSVTSLNISSSGMHVGLNSPWGEAQIQSPLMGRFNLYNLMSAFAVLMLEGFRLNEVIEALEKAPAVPGRMQAFGGKGSPRVVVDYAHTPDALLAVLQALKEHCHSQLICVFGCGGDRDKGKRAQMGKVAELYADRLIITDDNPRSEDSELIVQDILEGISRDADVKVIHDRKRAIFEAVQSASAEDVVLVAGKGHEEYQQIGADCFPFNDAHEAKLALEQVA